MSTENRVFSRLFDENKHAARLRAEKRKEDKLQKVALGLVDSLDYNLMDLQDETGRLSYSVEEWFDETFDKFLQTRGDLRAVYLQNSEAFLTVDDVEADKERLDQIKEKAEELGLTAEDVYPEWQEHYDAIEYMDYLETKFDEQVDQLRQFGVE